jgi:hypothetical protein
MFGFSVKSVAAVVTAIVIASGATRIEAQTAHRTRRESNANRKARIERTIQDTYSRRWEVGGGGGYLRFRSGEHLQRNAKVGNTVYNIPNPQISQYTFMAGPNYRVRIREKYAVSVFGTAGAGIGKFDSGSKGIPAQNLGLWPSETRAVFSVGGNLDYNFFPNLAARVTPVYLGSTWGGTIQNNLGVNVGLIYRFGRIR